MDIAKIEGMVKVFKHKLFINVVEMLRSNGRLSYMELAWVLYEKDLHSDRQPWAVRKTLHDLRRWGIANECTGIDAVHGRYEINEDEYNRIKNLFEQI